jgi:hypothetical protein
LKTASTSTTSTIATTASSSGYNKVLSRDSLRTHPSKKNLKNSGHLRDIPCDDADRSRDK